MTPGARLSAAIAVLDAALAGAPLERALTAWARGARYAGSGDRAAVRDIAYGGWRCRRSFAALGGAETGRGIVLGGLRAAGTVPARLMTGQGHAPLPPDATEAGRAPERAAAQDLPDWLWPLFRVDLGPEAEATAQTLRHRAPVFLRVNLARITRTDAVMALSSDGIGTRPHPDIETALEVIDNQRKVAGSVAFSAGLVELQDASSQDAVAALPLCDGDRVLDYCAGGGGKALAMAARTTLDLWAHDADPARLTDLTPRAARAGVRIGVVETAALAAAPPFDLVLVDAPCSGSGTWRRDPDGKWRLTPARLAVLVDVQAQILDDAGRRVRSGGTLAYVTCSVLHRETKGQVRNFLSRNVGWTLRAERTWRPGPSGDGFSLAILSRTGPDAT